ncbi:MAG TPA: mechanosensitive ion channel [Geminicoccaceae bacterium]|nr:mechanosensitive ion channel [Geminicoccus sp.]HMU51251.1 mechanosensitive ion channel [Geminicoccaceae bacterium]
MRAKREWRDLGRHTAMALLLVLLATMPASLASVRAQETASPSVPPAAAPQVTPEQARRALAILGDETRRAEVVELLRTLATAAPTGSPADAAEPAAAAPAPEPTTPVTIERGGLLSQLLVSISSGADAVIDRVLTMVRPLSGLPSALAWIAEAPFDPDTRALILDATWKVIAALGLALIAEWAVRRALARPRRALVAAAAPPSTLAAPATEGLPARLPLRRRFLLACGCFALDMLPILAFAVVGIAAAAIGTLVVALASQQQPAARLIIMILINAHVAWAVLTALAHRVISSDIHRLRLLPMTDAGADYAYRTVRRLLTFVVYALAALEIARVLGIGYMAYSALLKLVVLVAHVMLIMAVLHVREPVARWIRGTGARPGTVDLIRGWAGTAWHLAAIFFLLALWVIWAADVRGGYLLMLRYFFSTALILVGAQILSTAVMKALDRMFVLEARDHGRFSLVQERATRYYPVLRRLVTTLVFVLTFLLLLQVWGVSVADWFGADGIGSRLLSAAMIVAIAGIVALALWESVNYAVDRHLDALGHRGERAKAARLRTLMPLLRTTLLLFVLAIVGLTALSEIGVNIAPLLAGAGIVGVAIGFGSQKLVQDVITGVFLLLENVMNVGDWVTVSGLSGSVENLSIRTIRLRAGDGSVHVVPFSSVTTVTNTNRGIGNAAISVTVDYAEDTDRVGEVLKSIGAELRRDPNFAPSILDDMALWGVDKVGGDGVTIVGQIRCLDSGRWGVQREFNRRMKKRFQELGIEIADPNRRSYIGPMPEDALVAGRAEPAGPTSATETRSPPPAALGHET